LGLSILVSPAMILPFSKTAKRVDLTLGKEFDSKVEITNGLSEGDLLVTRGQGLLKDGSNVEIKAKAK